MNILDMTMKQLDEYSRTHGPKEVWLEDGNISVIDAVRHIDGYYEFGIILPMDAKDQRWWYGEDDIVKEVLRDKLSDDDYYLALALFGDDMEIFDGE